MNTEDCEDDKKKKKEQEKLNETLYDAVKKNSLNKVRECLKRGANVNFNYFLVRTTLHWAAYKGNLETTELLISSGADLSSRDTLGNTPLHDAAQYGVTEICQLLISSGSDPTAVNKQGNTPLHNAAGSRNTELCQLLISSGSDPTAVNKEGYTPLHEAALNGYTEIFQLMISSGSDLNAASRTGDTPLHIAAKYRGNAKICQLLISSGSDPTAVNMEAGHQNCNTHSIPLKCISMAGKGETPLHIAAHKGDVNTAKCLIIHGADLFAKTEEGKTPVDTANEEGKTTMSAFLKKIISSNLPREVQYLSCEDSASFGSLLKTGFYKSYVGKIMTVGHEAVGKTTITDVLRGKEPSKVRKSTEGIDVHTYQAAVDIEEKLWVKRELKPFDVAYRNLMMPSSSTKTNIESMDLDIDTKDDSDFFETKRVKDDDTIWRSACNKKFLETLPLFDVKRSVIDRLRYRFKPKVEITTEALYANSLKFGKKLLVDKALVPVTMWDFAGQAAFYSTHQTFLTYRGIYIIPINVSIGFDEEIKTESFIPGRHGKPTSREFTFFWICSILSYSKGETEGYPKIIPVCTHKDKISQENLEEKVNYIYEEIRKEFESTPWIKHLVIDKKICLNALNKNDPDYEVLQNVLVDCLCSQPSWGEKLPKAWIPLQLAINLNRENGRKLIDIGELLIVNEKNPVQALTQKELMVFLKIMHAQGDILFFPLAGLRDYVIISPSFFVDAIKSLVTHKRFVKGTRGKVMQSLNETGQLKREVLYSIWKDKKEFYIHKDHLFAVMIHLDIISVPRKYSKSGKLMNSDFLYVPSLINKVNNTTYTTRPNLQGKVMAISFKFQSIIPPAVGNRLIASCTDMFEVKQYENQSMLFSGMVVLTVKKNLDLAVILRGDRIDVVLVHDEARFYIVSDTAIGLFECLADILSTISDSFKKASSNNMEQHAQAFSVEYPCYNMESPCYNATRTPWSCPQHCQEMDQAYFSRWTIDRQKETCAPDCQGIKENDFQHKPSELQLAKLSVELSWTDMYQVMILLGMKVAELKAIEEDNGRGQKAMFLCLRQWKRKVYGNIGDLHKALTEKDQDAHLLCKMNRDRPLGERTKEIAKQLQNPYAEHIFSDHVCLHPFLKVFLDGLARAIPRALPDYLQHKSEPSDRDLDLIAAEVIDESILLAVQLGQDAKDWLQMKADNFKIININREILGKWRQEKTTKSKKMEEIAQALCNVGIHISSILQEE